MEIAIFGLGTVGSGVYELSRHAPGIHVKKVLEKRFTAPDITDNIEEIVCDPEISAVCETMGGLHPAYEFAVKALENGKHFITANKLLVSTYGLELQELAKAHGCAFLYSAACGGGIPYLQNLRIAHETDRVTRLGGILNGTTNLILDAMQSDGRSYDDVLAEAQRLGYAERDPSSDVDGLDTMRKLILACAVAFDVFLSADDIPTAGIAASKTADVGYAMKHGMTIRLCAYAEKTENGVNAYVEPELIPAGEIETAIRKNINFAWYEAEGAGRMTFSGQGAGKLATASNVLRDVQAAMIGLKSMTQPALVPGKNECAAVHTYYVRIPADADFPAAWIAGEEACDGYRQIETVPVAVRSMHEEMKKMPGAFFAGIRKG